MRTRTTPLPGHHEQEDQIGPGPRRESLRPGLAHSFGGAALSLGRRSGRGRRRAAATMRSFAIQSLNVAVAPGETGCGAVQDDSMLIGSGPPIRSLCAPKSTGSGDGSYCGDSCRGLDAAPIRSARPTFTRTRAGKPTGADGLTGTAGESGGRSCLCTRRGLLPPGKCGGNLHCRRE